MKSILKCVFSVLLPSVGLAALVGGLWSRLPWNEYEAVAKLRCYENRDGNKHYAFVNGEKNFHLLETVERMSEKWRTDKFRADVGANLRAKGWDGKVRSCVDWAKIEVKCDRACVWVVVRSDDRGIVCACATEFANAIVSTQKESEEHRVAQGVEQLNRNCDRMESCVAKIAKKLDAAKAGAVVGGGEIAALEKELVCRQKTLDAMRESATRMKKEKANGIFFETMPLSVNDIFVVRLNLCLFFLFCMFVVSLVVVGYKFYCSRRNVG